MQSHLTTATVGGWSDPIWETATHHLYSNIASAVRRGRKRCAFRRRRPELTTPSVLASARHLQTPFSTSPARTMGPFRSFNYRACPRFRRLQDFLVQNGGNVGIGTTSPATTLSTQGNEYTTGGLGIGVLNTSAGTLLTSGNGTLGGVLAVNGGTGTSTIASGQGFSVGGSQFVVQQGSGHVGIGTTTPLTPLAIFGSESSSPGLGFLNFGNAANPVQGFSLRIETTDGDLTLDRDFGGWSEMMRFQRNTGNVVIGTSSPSSRLTVWGADAASSTLAFNVVNSASTTVFSVFDGGNAELSGSLSQSSDQRLKTNIQSLDASSSLSFIDELNPVTFNWVDPKKARRSQLGFIAQQVLRSFRTSYRRPRRPRSHRTAP